jgi:hypothetical protein
MEEDDDDDDSDDGLTKVSLVMYEGWRTMRKKE